MRNQNKIQAFLNHRLRGGALFIAILISIIIGVILSLSILVSRYNRHESVVVGQSSQLFLNIRSGFELARSGYFNGKQVWLKNTFNNDSISIEKKAWGAFILINVTTKNRHQQLSESGLFGTFMAADTALVVSNNHRPVGVSGKVVFNANCYVPEQGLKPTYIEGQSYVSANQNTGFLKPAPAGIPQVTDDFIKTLDTEFSGFNAETDSLAYSIGNTTNISFSQKTLVGQYTQNSLNNVTLKNNIKLLAGDIVIDSTCSLENILIVCNKVHFNRGFKGKLHVIARDSIVCEAGCEFSYPSSLVLLPDNNPNTAMSYIQFSNNCKFWGGVLAINRNTHDTKPNVFIRLHSGCEINGLVYSNNYLHLQGTMNANVFADRLLLKTPSSVYENHMLACELNPKKYASVMAVPLLFSANTALRRCEKLY